MPLPVPFVDKQVVEDHTGMKTCQWPSVWIEIGEKEKWFESFNIKTYSINQRVVFNLFQPRCFDIFLLILFFNAINLIPHCMKMKLANMTLIVLRLN